MTQVTLPLSLRISEEKVLHAFEDDVKKPLRFTELWKLAKVSMDSLSEALKRLQDRGMVKRDIHTRAYSITNEGLGWLKKSSLADTIKNGSIREERWLSPVTSIVAVDVPAMPQAQQVYGPGTPGIARACLKQALMDTLKAKERSEIVGAVDPRNLLPKTGRVAYMATIDWNKVKEWADTTEGKKLLREALNAVKEKSKDPGASQHS